MFRLVRVAVFAAPILLKFGIAAAESVPPSLLKTWTGTVCNGKARVVLKFTGTIGQDLYGEYSDSAGGAGKIGPDGWVQAKFIGGKIFVVTGNKTRLELTAGGSLNGRYFRGSMADNRSGCPDSENVSFS